MLALAKDPNSDVDFSKVGRVPDIEGLPLVKPPYGRITAIDMSTGELRWTVANADTPETIRTHPALAGLNLPRTGILSRAMLLATATVLIAGEGFGGSPILRVHDKHTGETLAEIEIPASVTWLRMSYLHDGRQYVVFAVGAADVPAELVAVSLAEDEFPEDDPDGVR